MRQPRNPETRQYETDGLDATVADKVKYLVAQSFLQIYQAYIESRVFKLG